MTLTRSFVTEYVKLDNERDAGKGIWRLCEMSAEVVVPRGQHESLVEYKKRTEEDGRTKQLSLETRKSIDTIQRRAFAWRMWERFTEHDLYDENGEEIDYTHQQVRDHLFWNHFSEIGRKVESEKIENDTAVMFLILSVKNGWSVRQMIGSLNDTMEVEEYFYLVAWPSLRERIKNVTYRYPQIKGRRRKLMVELISTDWQAKENGNENSKLAK